VDWDITRRLVGLLVLIIGVPGRGWRRLKNAEDPTVAKVVWAIVLVGAFVGAAAAIGHSPEAADYGLKALGGVLVLMTAYFTARNLRQTARAAFLERLMRAAELLADQDRVKQAAGVHALDRLLESKALDSADREAIGAVLRAYIDSDSADPSEKSVARETLRLR
jgi:hypothetical protein